MTSSSLIDRITRSSAEDEALIKKVIEKVLASDILKNELISKIQCEIFAEYQQKLQALTGKVVQLEADLVECRNETKRSVDNSEQYSRRNNLRIFGVPEERNEDTSKVVTILCKEKLKLDISPDLMDSCHRLPGKEPQHRPIIVKFLSHRVKKMISNNKKLLKGTKLVIREDLTQFRNSLMKAAVKKYGNKSVWSNDGKIYVKVDGKVIILKTFGDIK